MLLLPHCRCSAEAVAEVGVAVVGRPVGGAQPRRREEKLVMPLLGCCSPLPCCCCSTAATALLTDLAQAVEVRPVQICKAMRPAGIVSPASGAGSNLLFDRQTAATSRVRGRKSIHASHQVAQNVESAAVCSILQCAMRPPQGIMSCERRRAMWATRWGGSIGHAGCGGPISAHRRSKEWPR